MMRTITLILSLGSLYALVAAGVVLVYRTSRVLNLAPGELAVVSGYLVVSAGALAGGSVLFGGVVALVLGLVTGALVYFLLMRRILSQPPFVGILVTVALALLLRGVVVLGWGGNLEVVELCRGGQWTLFGTAIPRTDVCTFAGSTLTFTTIYLLYQSSNLGVAMRAVAENVTLAAQRGINIDRIIAAAWMVAVASGVVAGALFGSRSILSLGSAVLGLKGIVAALIGGLDSLKGAAVGGLAVAAAEYYTTTQIDSRFAELTPIVLLLLVLLVRPWGIFGTAEEVERV